MKYDWDKNKNLILKKERDVSFEEVLLGLSEGRLLDVLPHFNTQQYPRQKLFIMTIKGYTYYIPFIEDEALVCPIKH
ncbi:MAG: hypothetical protein U9P71_02350 [Campylobacterota bacterium]|nr:hypothetical protein [Campylobacterota bacterium]